MDLDAEPPFYTGLHTSNCRLRRKYHRRDGFSSPLRPTIAAAAELLRRGEPPCQTLIPSSSAPIPFNMADALTPLTPAPSPAPLAAAVLSRRRSHLDSTSYRTLSRLFSHCFRLHPSRSEGPTPPEPEVAATNPTGVYSGDSLRVPKDADFDRRTADVENKAAGAGSPSRHVTCTPARDQPSVANPTVDPGAAEAPQVTLEDMDALVESTFVKPGAVIEELVIEATVVVEEATLKSAKACLEGEVDKSVEEAMGNDNGQLLLDVMMTNFAGLIDDIGVDSMPAQSCGASEGNLQSKESEDPKQLGGWTEEERPASNSGYRQVGSVGFEEGEIEGELQDLGAAESDSEPDDEYADDKEPGGTSVSRGSGATESHSQKMRCGNEHLILQNKGTDDPVLNKEVSASSGGQLYATRAQTVSYGEVLDWNETPLPEDEVLVVSMFLLTNILYANCYISCLLLHLSVDALF
jgi:hypothetical protein